MRILQITEQDKMELSELGHRAVKSVHEFLECLDKVTDGQISQEMAEYYGERQGAKGTGPYSRYNRRDGNQGGYGERGGGYNEHYPAMPGGYMPPYFGTRSPRVMPPESYGERGGYGERGQGGYNNRYEY